jgi:IS4 transposase
MWPDRQDRRYRARWNAELDLRSLKQTMQMDILRCKTPELVRKEIWTHLLAYNLIRTIIAQPQPNTASTRDRSASRGPGRLRNVG